MEIEENKGVDGDGLELGSGAGVAEGAITFAVKNLGRASGRLIEFGVGARDVERRLGEGRSTSDAVLGAVFDALLRGDGEAELAEEFFAYLLPHAEARSHGRISTGLKRHMESQDIAQSVFGNLWQDLPGLEFRTFPQFLSMVIQRIGWKASNRVRDLRRKKRSEDARVDLDVGGLGDEHSERGPLTELVRAEDRELFIETIMTLPNQRDRRLIMDYLEGRSIREMAESFELEEESARRALNRALERAREHLEVAKRDRGIGRRPRRE
jgi:RNA polymerase sigma factor (sigma-70 family)